MISILDACTVINLLHIDEDEFLMKSLKELNFYICKTVFDEISNNVYNKFKLFPIYPSKEHNIIEKKLNYFRDKIYHDETYIELESDIRSLTNYGKTNGEFKSVLLSFYLNTLEKGRIFFYTDDVPAKEEFMPYYKHSRIGFIEDSVDLLVLLYRHNSNFSKRDLSNFLSNLYSEFATSISAIETVVNEYEIPKIEIKNVDLLKVRTDLIKCIRNRDLISLRKAYFKIIDNKASFKSLFDILKKFDGFFRQNISDDYLHKIQNHIKDVETKPFYKRAS